jgi:hypothetical protein
MAFPQKFLIDMGAFAKTPLISGLLGVEGIKRC